MSQRPQPAPVRSFAEAYLYAMVAPCPVCAGALNYEEAWFGYDPAGRSLRLEAVCQTCEAPYERVFDAAGLDAAELDRFNDGRLNPPWSNSPATITPSSGASEIIDVAGWLTLFTLIGELARVAGDRPLDLNPPDRATIRRMRLVAGACLDEALKFFEDDNDLPPDDAFFSDASRRQFWERPELFTRQYIADLRFSMLRSSP